MSRITIIRKIMRVLEARVRYQSGRGALCPICGVRMPATSTYHRDAKLVLRRHTCRDCGWTFTSVEDRAAR